ncbi:MAG: histidine phosphatase family protein [bacterium]|nr:histidine phosphatase family protein [bacterium]
MHFDAIYSSDLLRAKETAEIAKLERKIVLTTTQALRERCFGRLEGKHWMTFDGELRKLWKKLGKLTDEERKLHNLKEVENNEQIINRCIPFLKKLAFAYVGKTLLIVSHGGVMRVLLKHIGFIPTDKDPDLEKDEFRTIEILNAAYIRIESDGTDFNVKETYGIEIINK